MNRSHILGVLLGVALIQGLVYSAVVPPWQAPDEPQHFEYARLLYEKRRLVGWADVDPAIEKEVITAMDRYDYWRFGVTDFDPAKEGRLPERFQEIWLNGHELHQPPLSYLVYTLPLFIPGIEDAVSQLRAMRVLSVLIGTLVVWLTFQTARELFPEDDVLLVAIPAFVIFLPMHAYLTSTVNNDHLAEFFVSAFILLFVRAFRRGFSVRTFILMAVVSLLGMLAKRTAIVTLPLFLLGMLIYLAGPWPGQNSKRRVVVGLFSALLAIVIVGLLVWYQFPNVIDRVYGLASHVLPHPGAYITAPSSRNPLSIDLGFWVSREALPIYRFYAWISFTSFWARFGWLNIPLHKEWYFLLAGVSLLSGAGLGLLALKAVRRPGVLRRHQMQALIFLLLCCLLASGLAVGFKIRQWNFLPEAAGVDPPQGRYLFTVIIPLATLFALGSYQWVPSRYRRMWLLVYLSGLAFFDLMCLAFYVIPFYYA